MHNLHKPIKVINLPVLKRDRGLFPWKSRDMWHEPLSLRLTSRYRGVRGRWG